MTLEERIEELERITGAITEVHNTKMDLDAHNVQSPSAVVIESQMPTSANNYTWYRKYSDGWVEQGGIVDYGSYAYSLRHYAVTLPIEMYNAQYQVLAGYRDADSSADYALNCGYNPNQLNTTGFRMTTWTTDSGMLYRYVFWQVSGKYAI